MRTINPYQTPTEDLLADDADGVGEIRFFSPSSRIGRLRYFAHAGLLMLALYAAALVLVVAMSLLMPGGIGAIGTGLAAIMVLLYIPFIVMCWMLIIQRLHDLDKSGWMSLLMLVPLVNFVFAIYVMCWPGTQGSNRFGKRPPPNKLWHWIVGLALPLPVVLGILAAVAIPAYQDYVERARQAQESRY